MIDNKQKAFLIMTLRRSSFRWKPRSEALKASKVGRNMYKCAHCPVGVTHPNKNKQIDHIDPVIPLSTGWVSADSFVQRLLCPKEGFQILCKEHHKIKTDQEKQIRKDFRQMAKKAKEKHGEE